MSDEKTPVTLEGIAAVLATVPSLIAASTEKDRQAALSDALRMLSRACVMAGGKVGAAHVDLADMLEPFRCAGEPDHTGALSHLIAENKGLKEYEAWVEQAVRLISTSGDISLTVKAGSNLPEAVGVLLEERKRLSTLEKECSDALDEYASFHVMGGEVKTLPERIRLLGDSRKAAHTEADKQVSRLLAEATKRETAARDAALEEVAASLRAL